LLGFLNDEVDFLFAFAPSLFFRHLFKSSHVITHDPNLLSFACLVVGEVWWLSQLLIVNIDSEYSLHLTGNRGIAFSNSKLREVLLARVFLYDTHSIIIHDKVPTVNRPHSSAEELTERTR
jgi:hypothetical protein